MYVVKYALLPNLFSSLTPIPKVNVLKDDVDFLSKKAPEG